MISIKEPHRLAEKYLKKEKPEHKTYRLLLYVLRLYDTETSVTGLYNLVTGEVAGLNKEEADLLDLLPCPYEKWMDDLIERHYLVPEDFDEKERVDFLRGMAGALIRDKKDHLNFIVIPTSACNAGCPYCFEEGIPSVYMDEKTADRTAEYIAATVKGTPARISWYGGEPTLKPDVIDRICRGLERMEVKWDSMILSNGYLLDETLSEKAVKAWHVKRAMISLDGNEETYNRTKCFSATGHDPESPYQRVLSNIETLLKKDIHVIIRLNLGRENTDSLKSLICELAPRFSGYRNCALSVAVLSENGCHARCGRKPALADEKTALISLADQMGFKTKDALGALRIQGCMAARENAVFINPKGELSNCYENFFQNTFGTVWDADPKIPDMKPEKYETPECRTCVLYPDCYRVTACPHTCSEAGRERRIRQMLYSLKKAIQDGK